MNKISNLTTCLYMVFIIAFSGSQCLAEPSPVALSSEAQQPDNIAPLEPSDSGNAPNQPQAVNENTQQNSTPTPDEVDDKLEMPQEQETSIEDSERMDDSNPESVQTSAEILSSGGEEGFIESIVSVEANYMPTRLVSTIFRNDKGDVLFSLEDARLLSLVDQTYFEHAIVDFVGNKYVNFKLLEDFKYTVDDNTLEMHIIFPARVMKKQEFDAFLLRKEEIPVSKSANGMFINYDVNMTQSKSKSDIRRQGAVSFEINNLGSIGYLVNSFSASKAYRSIGAESVITRNYSYWGYDDVDRMSSWQLGDANTQPASWSGSTQYLGLKYSTNYSVNRYFVSTPIMDYYDSLNAPSEVTIKDYSEDHEGIIFDEKLRLGEFSVKNIKISGKGYIEADIEGVDGSSITKRFDYNIIPGLLKTGLSSYSFDVGIQKRSNGTEKTNLYRDMLLSTDYAYGVNNHWTLGSHFEWMKNQSSFGVQNNIGLWDFGVLGIDGGFNFPKTNGATRLSVNYSNTLKDHSINIGINRTGRYFRSTFDFTRSTIPEAALIYNINYNFSPVDAGSFSASYSMAEAKKAGKKSFNSAGALSYSKTILTKFAVSASIGRNLTGPSNKFANISVSNSFSKGKYLTSLRASKLKKEKARSNSRYSASVKNTGDPFAWSYSGNFSDDGKKSYNVSSNKDNSFGTIALGVSDSKGGTRSFRSSLKGAASVIGSTFSLSKTINGGLILVKVADFEGIPVKINNRLTGYTNSSGEVAGSASAFTTTSVSVEPKHLPLSASFNKSREIIVVKKKNGVVVSMDITRVLNLEMTFVDEFDEPIPFDSLIVIDGLAEDVYVGEDGLVFVGNASGLSVIEGKVCSRERICWGLKQPFEDNGLGYMDIGIIKCTLLVDQHEHGPRAPENASSDEHKSQISPEELDTHSPAAGHNSSGTGNDNAEEDEQEKIEENLIEEKAQDEIGEEKEPI